MPGGTVQAYMDLGGLFIRQETGSSSKVLGFVGLDYVGKTRAALLKLRAKPNGKKLLETVGDLLVIKKKTITIERAGEVGGQGGSGWDPEDYLLRWSTDEHKDAEDWDQLSGVPTFIILGHELVHALHTLNDSTDYGHDSKTNNAIEETRTVGLGPWATEKLSENGLRGEWKVRLRETFQGVTPDRLLIGTRYA